MSELLGITHSISFLAQEDAETCRSFAELGSCRTFPRGNILFHHDDACLAAYVIVSGKVKLCLSHEDGRELSLDVFGPGDVVGLVAAIDGKPHTGTAITALESRIAIIPRERFQAWLAARPLLQGRILLEVVELLRHAYKRVGSQALLSVKHRVRETLIAMAIADGDDDGIGIHRELVVARPTHQELAERVGSTRVVVSRAIKELLEEEDGISMEGRVLRVRLQAVDLSPSQHARARV
jgi:CRP/FNR family transcriptional regulator, cyclic AMP receptor protein